MSINLKDTTYLLNNGFIMVTKKGTAWRCGKGYRKDWSKLIGKEVLLHGSSYTLTNRVKKEGKWYLVYTDGQNNYTELQSKALHNKNMAKDTIIETVKKELIDKIIEEVEQITNKHFNSHNKPSKYYHSFKSAVAFIKRNGRFYRDKLPGYYRELSNCYHPDRHNTHLYQQPYTAEDYMSVIQTLKPQKRSKRSNKPTQLLLPAPKELIDQILEQVNFMAHKSNEIVLANAANYTKKGTFRKNKQDKLTDEYKPWLCVEKQNNPFNYNEWQMKIQYVRDTLMDLFFLCEVAEDNEVVYSKEYIKQYTKKVLKQLQLRYHPDRNKSVNANDEFRFVQKKLSWINNVLFKVA